MFFFVIFLINGFLCLQYDLTSHKTYYVNTHTYLSAALAETSSKQPPLMEEGGGGWEGG